jgi:hypothetical protein
MKTIRKIFIYGLGVLVLAILFRGCLYRTMFGYQNIGARENHNAKSQALRKAIDEKDNETEPDIRKIIDMSLSLTANKLNFVAAKNNNDPNKLINTKKAHCVGYSAFFATTCNYLIKKHGLKEWHAKPAIGKIYFLGLNVHEHIDIPFFEDHDFVIIENENTKEQIAVDPALYDYIYIDKVKLRQAAVNSSQAQ